MDQRAERTWTEGIPPALVVALGAEMVFGGLLDGVGTYLFGLERMQGDVVQWLAAATQLAWRGLAFAATVLAIAGYLDLSRRVPPRQAPLLLVGVGALGLLLVCSLVWMYLMFWWLPGDHDRWERYKAIGPWLSRVRMIAALLASGALIGAGWERREVRYAAAPLLIATALAFPSTWLWEVINFAQPGESTTTRWMQLAVDLYLRAMWVGATLYVAGSIGRAVPSPAGWHRGGRGLHLAGSALVARVIVAAAVVLLTIMMVSARSSALGRATIWLIPLAVVSTIVALVVGLLQGAGTGAEGAPRLRLYTAAGLLCWTAVVQAIQATIVYQMLRARLEDHGGWSSFNERLVGVFPYATPLVGLAALLCALSAATALRRRIPGGAPDDGAASTAAVLVCISTAAAMLLQKWILSGIESRDGFVFATFLIAVATIVGQLAVGRVLHRTGAAMQEVPELPVATVAEAGR